MITHTTYLGHSQMIEAAVFLDRVMPPQVLFRFNGEKPQKILWSDYESIVTGLAAFDKKSLNQVKPGSVECSRHTGGSTAFELFAVGFDVSEKMALQAHKLEYFRV